MTRCGDCKFWEHIENDKGMCDGIVGEGWGSAEEQAMLSDPSSLYTKRTFGCAIGEPSE